MDISFWWINDIDENWYLTNIGETTVDFTESYFD